MPTPDDLPNTSSPVADRIGRLALVLAVLALVYALVSGATGVSLFRPSTHPSKAEQRATLQASLDQGYRLRQLKAQLPAFTRELNCTPTSSAALNCELVEDIGVKLTRSTVTLPVAPGIPVVGVKYSRKPSEGPRLQFDKALTPAEKDALVSQLRIRVQVR